MGRNGMKIHGVKTQEGGFFGREWSRCEYGAMEFKLVSELSVKEFKVELRYEEYEKREEGKRGVQFTIHVG